MPVLMSPPGVQETWPSVHPESDPESDPPAAQQQHHHHLDDSLTSLHWLQNFSIINADPERCGHASSSISSSSSWSSSSSSWSPTTSSSLHHHHHHHLQHPQSYPQSPPAGDTAATGMPTHLGSPVTSVSDCGLLNYAHQAHAHQTRHGHLGGVVARPLQAPLQTPAADVDYKSDPKVKPPYSYASLICMAMQASQRPKVTLSTIYSWITENFCYYRHAEPSWQNSIRHNLSLNKCFIKVPRQKDEPGKGGFWQIDPQYADMFVNGIFKRRRMSTNHYNNNNNNSNSSGGGNAHRHGKLGRDAPYHRIQNGCLYQGGSGGAVGGGNGRRKPHPPGKSHGGKGARTPKSPLLATEAHCGGGGGSGDVLRGDFDLASVFDDVLGGGCSNFEDLDINTALSSLGCEMEASLQAGRHAARWCGEGGELQGGATTTTTTAAASSANDRQNPPGHQHHHHHHHHHPHLSSYGYLELSCGANVEVGHVVGMTSDLHAPHHHHQQQQQLHQDQMLLQPPHHHLQQQQQFEETSPPLFPEQPTEEEVVILPWDEIKEEAQVIPLSLDQGFGLCEGFFAEMQPWERVEAYL